MKTDILPSIVSFETNEASHLNARDVHLCVANKEPNGSDLVCLRDSTMSEIPSPIQASEVAPQAPSAISGRPKNIREFESKLRTHFGLSSREAKTVASRGWAALTGEPIEQKLDEIAALIAAATKQLTDTEKDMP